MGACGQVQRRSRSEQAQHGWRRIQSIQEGPPGLEGAKWAGMWKVPGEEHRACGTSETQLQLGRGAQLGGTGEMDYMGRWESRALEQVGRLSRGPDSSDIHGQGGPEVTHETHRAGHQEGGSQGVGVDGGSRAAPGAGMLTWPRAAKGQRLREKPALVETCMAWPRTRGSRPRMV